MLQAVVEQQAALVAVDVVDPVQHLLGLLARAGQDGLRAGEQGDIHLVEDVGGAVGGQLQVGQTHGGELALHRVGVQAVVHLGGLDAVLHADLVVHVLAVQRGTVLGGVVGIEQAFLIQLAQVGHRLGELGQQHAVGDLAVHQLIAPVHAEGPHEVVGRPADPIAGQAGHRPLVVHVAVAVHVVLLEVLEHGVQLVERGGLFKAGRLEPVAADVGALVDHAVLDVGDIIHLAVDGQGGLPVGDFLNGGVVVGHVLGDQVGQIDDHAVLLPQGRAAGDGLPVDADDDVGQRLGGDHQVELRHHVRAGGQMLEVDVGAGALFKLLPVIGLVVVGDADLGEVLRHAGEHAHRFGVLDGGLRRDARAAQRAEHQRQSQDQGQGLFHGVSPFLLAARWAKRRRAETYAQSAVRHPPNCLNTILPLRAHFFHFQFLRKLSYFAFCDCHFLILGVFLSFRGDLLPDL